LVVADLEPLATFALVALAPVAPAPALLAPLLLVSGALVGASVACFFFPAGLDCWAALVSVGLVAVVAGWGRALSLRAAAMFLWWPVQPVLRAASRRRPAQRVLRGALRRRQAQRVLTVALQRRSVQQAPAGELRSPVAWWLELVRLGRGAFVRRRC